MRKIVSLIALLLIIAFLAGCGETIRGAVKDTKRIGSGIKRVFVAEQ
jgi:predicted small secreted protein